MVVTGLNGLGYALDILYSSGTITFSADNPNGLNQTPTIILLINGTVSLYSTTSSVLEL